MKQVSAFGDQTNEWTLIFCFQTTALDDPNGLSRFFFQRGNIFRTAAPPTTVSAEYGDKKAAQRFIDRKISQHSCVKFIPSGWCWRCGLYRLGRSDDFAPSWLTWKGFAYCWKDQKLVACNYSKFERQEVCFVEDREIDSR
jgi:hypothetical protein